ncbi:integrin alpha [Conexibacter sp. SYSU D00693]|uniref:integrin alpha n=1 Tax=Conexibacter sp. SYSU D00693 TaxID=2812560 RepID=UPI00196ACB13|nr:integrin alpha [Conexibacter sp. SYSU D00693]
MRRLLPAAALLAALVCAAPAGAQELPDYIDTAELRQLELRSRVPDAVAGSALATGDFDGDGNDDLAVGARGLSPLGRDEAGGVEVLFGPITGRRAAGRLMVYGAEAHERAGTALANAGDVDGDGADDLAIGAYQASPVDRPAAGRVYVVFGRGEGELDLANLGPDGQKIWGAMPADNLGRSLASVGDQDGDGRPDLLLGAPGADPGGRVRAGAAFVVRGDPTPERIVDLAAPGDQAFAFAGPSEGATAGWSVAGGGDRDGDGLADYAIAAPEDVTRSGRVWLVKGGWRPGSTDLLLGGPGIQGVVGPRPGSLLGFSLADVGDVTGDRLADIAAGAWGSSPRQRKQAGQVYVLPRNGALLRPTVFGATDRDRAGRAVAAAGDMDGDGRRDLLVGSSAADVGDVAFAGAAAVVRGTKEQEVDLAIPEERLLIAGSVQQSRFGDALAGDADLDGDGRPDLAVSAPGSGGRSLRGGVYLVRNPYPVRLSVLEPEGGWCDVGRLDVGIRVTGAASLGLRVAAGRRSRTSNVRARPGAQTFSLRWPGGSGARATLRVRARGSDGQTVTRTVRVPDGC